MHKKVIDLCFTNNVLLFTNSDQHMHLYAITVCITYSYVNVIFICIALLKQHKLTNVLYILTVK